MRQFIKRILYCFIFFFTFLLLMYIIAFCVGKPELNKDRYIKLYDDQNKIFYQSVNNYSGQYVSIDDVSDCPKLGEPSFAFATKSLFLYQFL